MANIHGESMQNLAKKCYSMFMENHKDFAKQFAFELTSWFKGQQRDLPWRKSRDPYPIWISEIMLQQTTTRAVIPYFEKFMNRFKTVKSLATSPLEDVYEFWAGLGYYSRARNIHKSAQLILKNGFPKDYLGLIQLPGIGPYASRAISSQAFGEKVGVVDGNVIRVYSRLFNDSMPWWKIENHRKIQTWADQLCQNENPSDLNQALMELGATICTPKSPTCLLCPVSLSCLAFKNQTQSSLPLKKPKKKNEIWIWKPEVYFNSKKEVLLTENNDVGFLKQKLVFPGEALKSSSKPENFDYKHTITHHEIYVQIQKKLKKPNLSSSKHIFVNQKDLSKKSPFALVKKAFSHL